MNIEAVFDIVALAAFVTALVIGAAIWFRGGRSIDGLSAGLMLGAMSLLTFVAVSNTLQYLGITSSLDPFEDYAEILIFPLMAYGIYAMHSYQQVNDLRLTIRAARAEHDLMLSIIDASPVGLAVADEHGRVTFANDLARGVLHIDDSDGATAYAARVRVVPVGATPDRDMEGVFHPSALRDGLTGMAFDVVMEDGDRLSIRVSTAALGDSMQHGIVVVFQSASVGTGDGVARLPKGTPAQ
ncbi:MAG: hypothetical protein U1E22_05730 [Coriobacteriia bacterium]|nr:hypothetical protein [Coriobacteriia bacterium]